MAKKRIVQRAKNPIKNNHLIGKGGKRITPVNGKFVEGYKKAFGKAPTKQVAKSSPTKTALKATTSLTKPNTPAFAKTVQTLKAKPTRLKGLQKMKAKISKSTPSKTQSTRTIKSKPTKGRGR